MGTKVSVVDLEKINKYLREKNARLEERNKMLNDKAVSFETLVSENNRLSASLVKEKSRSSIFTETIKKYAISYPPQKIPKYKPRKTKHLPEKMVGLFSDPQIGEKVESDDVAGMEEYNFPIFKQRLDKWEDGILSLHDNQSAKRDIPELDLFMLGDMVEGETIYPGQAFHIDMPLYKQLIEGSRVVAEKVLRLATVFPLIEVFCVQGNHGRPGKPGENHHRSSFDYLFYQMLSAILSNQSNVKIHLSESPVMGVKVYDTKCLLIHGDEVPMFLNFPFYGLDRVLKSYSMALNTIWDVMCAGHYHVSSSFDVSTSEVVANGSFAGSSYYVFRKIKTVNTPKQTVFGVHPRNGITWRFQLKLSEKSELSTTGNIMTPNEDGMGHSIPPFRAMANSKPKKDKNGKGGK